MKTKINILLASLLLLFFTGCKNDTDKSNHKLRIVTTTGMIADAVKNITGDSAEVIALMGPGVDPHLYKATQGDLQKLQQADVIIYNGLHLEGKMSDILEKMSANKTVIVMSNGIDISLLRNMDGFKDSHDPHIWFDVKIWALAVDYMANGLMKKDSIHASFYQSNKLNYLKGLHMLDEEVRGSIATIPAERRVLITAHDAFGYFGRAYNIEVKGLQGISTVSDFGLNDITQLVNFISERKIKAVFIESSVSPRSIEAVVKGCQENGHDVKIGGTLYSDAMGAAGTPDGTYIGMVRSNVKKIVEALK